ncbi:TerD family protein [Streptomyces griseocarneus]|uniref:TerD family protein n=1 Tax=Streptomyces griseocarneus TaxID=51201 RepID=UPI00167EE0D2|nr:TerD family protein [Streptomyces griseocarneus]MBZ6471877.1 TerD family protein [Streptomyces griseocarneus]GHG71381.1 export associated protein [Streptomyces griseocarneus]
MTAELVRGQNHPLSGTRLEIRVSAGQPVMAGATLGDADGRVPGDEWVAHPASPRLPGLEVSRQAAAEHRLAIDLDALPEAAHRVNVLLALPSGPSGPGRFGALAAPFVAVTGTDGTELASYTVTGLDAESAVVALELYRRQDAWKVRAVGQGYAGGLTAMLHDQGLPRAAETAARIEDAVAQGASRAVSAPPAQVGGDAARRVAPAGGGPADDRAAVAGHDPAVPSATTGSGATAGGGAPSGGGGPVPEPAAPAPGPISYRHPGRRTSAPPEPAPAAPAAGPGQPYQPVAGDATGWTMNERLYNQVWGMFEDLARAAAAYRSAVDFAESRLEQELDRVLSDPRTRVGPAADAAREEARSRQAQLVEQARGVLDRDLDRLVAEAEVVEHALPPAFARWDSPVWHGYQVPLETPMALRLGDLHLPERRDLRIPMLVRLPLERGLWIDSGRFAGGADASLVDSAGRRRLAMDCAVAHAVRLLAVHPVGDYSVHVIDPAGAAGAALAPLLENGALKEPPVAGARGVSEVLGRLTQRVDLVQMAVRSGAVDSLPPDLDTSEQLLIVNDFPHGFDDRSVTQLRYLADEGPSVGVHLMMVADREDARAYGPVLDPLWRSLLRVTPVPDDHLADPWVGHSWTYEPSLAPSGSEVLRQVLWQVGQARKAYGI